MGAHLDDGRRVREIVAHTDPWRRDGDDCRRVGFFLLCQPFLEAGVVVEGTANGVAERGPTRRITVFRGDHECGDRHGADAGRAGTAHVETMHGKGSGVRRQQPGTVGGDGGDAKAPHPRLDVESELAAGSQGAQVRFDRFRRRHRSAGEDGGHAPGQVPHHSGLPVVPGGRPRGRAVGHRQRAQQLDGAPIGDAFGDPRNRARVVEVASRRDDGQQEVLEDEGAQSRRVGGCEAHPRRDHLHHLGAHDGMITIEALADVVQEGGCEQQVGPVDPARHLSRVHGCFHEVAVDGEAVQGVALGQAAHVLPLGKQPGHDADLIERFHDVDQGRAGAEEGHERVAGRVGPRLRNGRRGRQSLQCVGRDRQVVLSCRRGGAEHEEGISAGVGVGC